MRNCSTIASSCAVSAAILHRSKLSTQVWSKSCKHDATSHCCHQQSAEGTRSVDPYTCVYRRASVGTGIGPLVTFLVCFFKFFYFLCIVLLINIILVLMTLTSR